ncbi:hypothetical protein V495_03444 [Pseudogymnoascus sp. VKM F-4514 (FW-929)]|nr:hypothetical protein V495_03444 [Pseudogymnoascus sp. VKM F-4514 (FW-929)]KFY62542.1 hypothetical protein V497_02331 [Pseudogymnoascus sp. VKM F-4516 (FW-969)]
MSFVPRNSRLPIRDFTSDNMTNQKRRIEDLFEPVNHFTSKRLRSTQPQPFNPDDLPAEERYRWAADLIHVPVDDLRFVFPGLEEQNPEQLLPHSNDYGLMSPHYPRRMKRATGRKKGSRKTSSIGTTSEKSLDGGTRPKKEKFEQQWNGQLDGSSDFPEPASESGRDKKQPMLPPDPAIAQYVGAQFDSYPQNYGSSMTGLPYNLDNGGQGQNDFGLDTPFNCDTNEFGGPWMQPVQQFQVQTQPHKQEMTYLQPHGYIESNISFGNSNGYPGPSLTDSGFVSDTSISHQESGTKPASDSGRSSTSTETAVAVVPTRRGPFKSQFDRDQTAQTRKDGCCLRCRHQKIRCIPDPENPKGICLTCKNVKAANMKVQKPTCIRYRITDVRLYKTGQVPGLEWSQRWANRTLKEMSTWENSDTVTIQVSEGYTSTPLKLVVAKFKPLKGDVLERSWVTNSGVKKRVAIPAYAVKDLSAARDAYKNYINQGGAEFFQGALNPKDRFLWMTYNMAITTSNSEDLPTPERKLLRMVLQLWIAIRLNTKSTNIVGPETLGMPSDIFDTTHPTPGRIPTPPVMGNQIELILSRDIQDPLRADILDALQKMIYSNKPKCWFTIYLCTFILLHNCSMITKHDSAYARKHGLQTRFARPAMVNEYLAGATALLAHFHFCNKGSYPFSAAAGERAGILSAAGLTESQIEFIDLTRKFVASNTAHFEDFRWVEAYDNDYYFISQLYEENWKPRIKI